MDVVDVCHLAIKDQVGFLLSGGKAIVLRKYRRGEVIAKADDTKKPVQFGRTFPKALVSSPASPPAPFVRLLLPFSIHAL